ncbi:MAG: carboxypeptidase-like regulatory domain-containing protein, partial [Ignavibacteriae bacterium]|nr:carboxypeptidase-like regulatory domain-containing protein [Ignavibacteriota bacterium]
MKNKYFNYLLVLTIFSLTQLFAQKIEITGKVIDKKLNKGLSFANVRIDQTNIGSASNKNGDFKLNVSAGDYTIIGSFIGYTSDTVNISLSENKNIDFFLVPIPVELAQVTVKPGENPAIAIIKKAIEKKKKIKSKIKDYKYSAYTKGLIKTTKDFQEGGVSLTTKDTAKLKITGILENESRGFFKAPDSHKDFIVARKQTANTPQFVNVLTGGTLVQSFYEDELTFMGGKIPSPISDDALTYYYFRIEKELAMDNQKVYQIHFETETSSSPGFEGKIFIADESYNLLKVDASLNNSANPGGLFDYVKVYQQFNSFQDEILLPIDYRLFAEGNYLGLAKFGFEVHTIMHNYEINTSIDDDLFDNAIISVLPDADIKDKIYWSSIQAIPNTLEETKAYSRIDSVAEANKAFGQNFSLMSSKIKLTENLSTGGFLSLYSFNKIEGHTLNLKLNFNDVNNQRLDVQTNFSYGFADRKFKEELTANYLLGDYRTTEISIYAFNKITDLFSESNDYNHFTSTFLSLITKYDFRDYYYSKGFKFNLSTDVLPFANVGIGFVNRTDNSANNNSDFSIFNTSKVYSANKQIYDSKTNALTASIKIDFRKYIEDGFFRRRISTVNSNIFFELEAKFSNKDFLKSENNFSLLKFVSYGSSPTFNSASINFYLTRIYSTGSVPFQMLYALPGNISAAGKSNSFRTLRIGEVFGDDVT